MIEVFTGFAPGNADDLCCKGGECDGIRVFRGHPGISDDQDLTVQVQQFTGPVQASGFQQNIVAVFSQRQGDFLLTHRHPSLTETIYPGARDVNVLLTLTWFSFCFSGGTD